MYGINNLLLKIKKMHLIIAIDSLSYFTNINFKEISNSYKKNLTKKVFLLIHFIQQRYLIKKIKTYHKKINPIKLYNSYK